MDGRLPRGITRQNGVFQVQVKYRGHTASAVEPTLYLAEIRKGRLLEALIQERPVGVPAPTPLKPWTLEHTYDRVSELYWKGRGGGKSTMLAARNAMAHFGRNTLVQTITPHMIDRWTEVLRTKGFSASSINKHLSALSKMVKFAYSRGASSTRPVIARLPLPPGRTRYLTAVEEAKMFNYLDARPGRDGSPFIRVLLETGMRISELLQLTEADVDFEREIIHIWKCKGNKPRIVPMTMKVRNVLRRRATGIPDARFFRRSYKYYRRTWNQLKEALSLADDPGFVIHCLRHTCASRLIHHGVHVLTVKEWMGHKSILSTLRYIHLAPKNLYDAVQVLETGRAPGPRRTTWEGDTGGWRAPQKGW